MSFVNEYIENSNSSIDIWGAKILSSGRIFYGSQSNNLYLEKFDEDGNLLWAKSYNVVNQVVRITEIIELNGRLFCLFNSKSNTIPNYVGGLLSIGSDSQFFWCKTFFQLSNHSLPPQNGGGRTVNSHIKLINQNIIISFRYNDNDLDYRELFLYKISFNGSVLLRKSIYDDSKTFALIQKLDSNIMIPSTTGSLMMLDDNFNIITSKRFNFSGSGISSFRILLVSEESLNGDFYVNGTLVKNGVYQHFFAQIALSSFQIKKLIRYQPISSSVNGIYIHGNDVYFARPDIGLMKFSSSLNLIFCKNLEYWNLAADISSNVVLGYGNSSSTDKLRYATNLDLDSCVTINVTPPSFQTETGLSFNDITNLNPTSFTETSVNNQIVLSNIDLSKEIICEISTPSPSLELSTIEVVETSIAADGTSSTDIIVQLRDENGIEITVGNPHAIVISTNAGTLSDPSGNTNNDGQYAEASITSSTTPEFAQLTFTVNGQPASDTAIVEFTASGSTIPIGDDTVLQSPHLYLQATGSDGTDATKGRHIRWAFRNALGEKHLPKGNLSTATHNFNKPNDFVKIYRAAYTNFRVTLDFTQETPDVVDDSNHLWIFRVGQTRDNKEFYVYFRNTEKYDQVRASINPLLNPYSFITNYGDELIEVETKKDLFFGVRLRLDDTQSTSSLRAETLSVNQDLLTADKVVSNRKQFSNTQLNGVKFFCENGRSVRFQTSNCDIEKLEFEFYGNFIKGINNGIGWEDLGSYALSTTNSVVYSQLEPSPGDVHGVWQRYNDDAFVNINNYQEKWDAAPEPGDRNIKQVVNAYISISDANPNNPTALEDIPLGNDPNDPNDIVTISNLDVLNLASYDYHVARLLGLGILDIDPPVDIVIDNGEKGSQTISVDQKPNYMYLAEYFTTADLEDGQGARDVHHLFLSLPTSNNDDRLPNPVNLNNIIPGIFSGGANGDPSPITDEDGYTYDGLSRYITLYTEQIADDEINVPFFNTAGEINLSKVTTPIFGGLEYKKDTEPWVKPELSNDPEYLNEVPQGEEPHAETRFLLIPEPQSPYFIHQQKSSGLHTYQSYGINWFSRANDGSQAAIQTLLRPVNPLRPPSMTNALLIRPEIPLLLTSQSEQDRLGAIGGDDKTLIRLTFNYDSGQELKNYRVPVDSNLTLQQLEQNPDSLYPDADEVFAEQVEIFFRNQVPNLVSGKALSVIDDPNDETLSIIDTGIYIVTSNGTTIIPFIETGTEDNFIGGVFVSGENKYVIHSVTENNEGFPVFKVYKKEISESILNGGMPNPNTNGELEPPILTPDGLFMAIENMQTPDSWGTPNPLDFLVTIGDNWSIHREVIDYVNDDGDVERYLEKSRGIWDTATITEVNEPSGIFLGMYRIELDNEVLNNHPQLQANTESAEWYRGIIRIFTNAAVSGGGVPKLTRKVLSVLRIENLGTSNNLVVFAQDPSYDPNASNNDDYIQIGNNVGVNFYPGYRVYLYENSAYGINEQNTLPLPGEDVRYTIFGFRSYDSDGGCIPSTGACRSSISVPSLMFAQELIEALPPEQPLGPLYATRPDFFGRSTYTFATAYQHKPHAVLFYRSNDEAFLNALYEKSTILTIRDELNALGGTNEEFVVNRWQNFFDFQTLAADGDYKEYPPTNGYKFPNPDKQAFFDWANSILSDLNQPLINDTPGSLTVGDPKIIDFVKGALYSAFVPLTQMPIIYKFLNGKNYKLLDAPQVIRDRNGSIIAPFDPKETNPEPEDTGFRMAPMAKIIMSTPEEPKDRTLFTDFKLDGTTDNLYFYAVKELSSQLKMSAFSPFLGPIKMVNTNPAETPEIKRIVPVLENQVLGTDPKIKVEVNAFSSVQNIEKLVLYRAKTMINAQSILTMDQVKIIDLVSEGQISNPIWTIEDTFDDLDEVPYGDGLYYRVVVQRKVEYSDIDQNLVTDYAPSKASKIVASIIVEVANPQSPTLRYMSTPIVDNEIEQVSLSWNKMTYNAKYHIYKMNNQGNWFKIHSIQSNDTDIQVSLNDTDLQDDTLKLIDSNGNALYHHFKVITENTSGMLSVEENILSIFNEDFWTEL